MRHLFFRLVLALSKYPIDGRQIGGREIGGRK
jgi:hypothetical protein